MDREQLEHLVTQVKAQQGIDLDLSGTGLTHHDLAHLMSNLGAFASIRSLNLAGNAGVTDAAVREVTQRLTGLTSLNLEGCANITDAAVREAAQCLTRLISLDLRWCRNITRLPEMMGQLAALENLQLQKTSLSKLPPSVESLKRL